MGFNCFFFFPSLKYSLQNQKVNENGVFFRFFSPLCCGDPIKSRRLNEKAE